MSGGHWDYQQFYIRYLAEAIEEEFSKDGIVLREYPMEGESLEIDLLDRLSQEEREFTLNAIKKLVKRLYQDYELVRTLDWFISGDYGKEKLLSHLKDLDKEL